MTQTMSLKDMSTAQLQAEHARLSKVFFGTDDLYEHVRADIRMSRIEEELDYRSYL